MTQLITKPDSSPTPDRLTDAQCRRLEDEAGLEYVDGQFVEKNMSRRSVREAMTIGHLLSKANEALREVEVYGSDLAYRCHPDKPDWVRKPDVSVVRKQRLAEFDDVGMMPIPADLAVEVVSPNDLANQVSRKVEEYLAAGFKLVWLVDPETKTVHVYRADGSVVRLHAEDQITAEPALPGFACKVAAFFE